MFIDCCSYMHFSCPVDLIVRIIPVKLVFNWQLPKRSNSISTSSNLWIIQIPFHKERIDVMHKNKQLSCSTCDSFFFGYFFVYCLKKKKIEDMWWLAHQATYEPFFKRQTNAVISKKNEKETINHRFLLLIQLIFSCF